ncbi:MAG: TrmH family RNA methyltransferase [Stellaceae bacterium]
MSGPAPSGGDPRRRSDPATRPHQRTLLRVCGLPAVAALCERDPGRVERLYFEPRLRRSVAGFCALLARARKPYREIGPAELARVAGTVLHGGVAAIARPQPLAAFDAAAIAGWACDGKPLLVLDGVGNPHNLGAIARSAAYFGIARMLLADRPDQALPSDASYRVAEGGLEHLSLHQAPLPRALTGLRRSYRILGTALDGGAPWTGNAGPKPLVLVFGNEETGLTAATLAACDAVMTIPGSGRVQSLNVAAAAAILIYLASRR